MGIFDLFLQQGHLNMYNIIIKQMSMVSSQATFCSFEENGLAEETCDLTIGMYLTQYIVQCTLNNVLTHIHIRQSIRLLRYTVIC